METVWISHPKLDGRKVEVPASSLWQHQRAGWEETDPPPPPTPRHLARSRRAEETSEAPATAGASALPETTPRGRRSTTKGDK